MKSKEKHVQSSINNEASNDIKTQEKPTVCRADGMDYVRASTFTVELKEEDRIKIAGSHKGFGGI